MSKGPLTDIERYRVEVEKLGKIDTIDLTITTIRGARGKRKLVGEAFARDAYTPIIYFKVLHATDVEDLYHRFMRQLIHRGYVPRRYRVELEGRFQEWTSIDLSPYDLSDHKRAQKPMQVEE